MRAKRAKGLLVCARSARGWCDETVSQRNCQEFGEVVKDMFFIECGLLFRNFQLIDLLYLTSFKSFSGGHARSACVGGACEARVGWHARSACVGGGWKHALGMRVGWCVRWGRLARVGHTRWLARAKRVRWCDKYALGMRAGKHVLGKRVGWHARSACVGAIGHAHGLACAGSACEARVHFPASTSTP
jgi:hypothetical protein